MSWDRVSLIVLSAFGCLTLLLTQLGEVLGRLPQIIHAWREVRRALSAPDGRGTETAPVPTGGPAGDRVGGGSADRT
ncbi:hypothetical protein BX265_1713 [Streptomyces sp. TLI_235]|nr:hypothetical protein [Streptomyces sp. TLI_235]PBC76990.1 hypothetical protein BX265_1713 [Streptomyces sp. TLI_235]